MKPTHRRQFIQHTAVLAGAVTSAPSLRAAGANDKVILGLIGPGGMGSNHLRAFAEYKDVEISLEAHHRNFLDCIRSSKPPNADTETGHLSAALAHFANIATRLGSTLKFDPAKEQFIGNDDANKLLRRTYREGHWAAPRGTA